MYVVNPLEVFTYLDLNAPETVFLACISARGIVVTLVTLVDNDVLLITASAPCPILVGVVAHLIVYPTPSPAPAVIRVVAKFYTLLLA